MKILVENGCYHLRNMGDVAMLQAAIERLSRLWPQAEIRVFTDEPQLLARYAPQAIAVDVHGRNAWFRSGIILGGLYRYTPQFLKSALLQLERTLQRIRPDFALALVCWRERIRGRKTELLKDFISELRQADLLIVSGGGDLNDEFADYAHTLLDVLSMATRFKVPFALFGQGVGPITQVSLQRAVRRSLPAGHMINVREALAAPDLLQSLGVSRKQICVTGDDAIEMAYGARKSEVGQAIGVNLRLASYSAVGKDRLKLLQKVLHSASAKYNADLLPVPISFHSTESDVTTISEILAPANLQAGAGAELDSPRLLIQQVALCRIVVTGSYHAAVFSLSQGIPAVCLAKSAYYVAKFSGLADQFGGGCTLLLMDQSLTEQRLLETIDKAWDSAEMIKPQLLIAARNQTIIANDAYQSLFDVVTGKRVAAHSTIKEPKLKPTC